MSQVQKTTHLRPYGGRFIRLSQYQPTFDPQYDPDTFFKIYYYDAGKLPESQALLARYFTMNTYFLPY
jgi:hypothetical protein